MAGVKILVGSVYGNAQHAAEMAEEVLAKEGIDCEVCEDPQLTDVTEADGLLVITSTTGQGDIPPNLEMLFLDLKEELSPLNGKPFAVAGLGDSSYGDTYCAAGKQWFDLLTELKGKPLAALLEVDAMECFEPEKPVTEFIETIKHSFA